VRTVQRWVQYGIEGNAQSIVALCSLVVRSAAALLLLRITENALSFRCHCE
jgi:hypothetical protein